MTSSILSLLAADISKYDFVIRIEKLYTKIRVYLRKDYFHDVYYNETLQKYSYTVIRGDQRVIGWDNATHHVYVSSYPHHYHSMELYGFSTIRKSPSRHFFSYVSIEN